MRTWPLASWANKKRLLGAEGPELTVEAAARTTTMMVRQPNPAAVAKVVEAAEGAEEVAEVAGQVAEVLTMTRALVAHLLPQCPSPDGEGQVAVVEENMAALGWRIVDWVVEEVEENKALVVLEVAEDQSSSHGASCESSAVWAHEIENTAQCDATCEEGE